jgi:hypothetical protein
MARSGERLIETCSLATAPGAAIDVPPACPSPWRTRLGGPAHLAHQQLVSCNQRERRPRRDNAARCRRLGDRDVRGQARRAARHQQRPRQEAAPAAAARIRQQRRRRRDDHPVDRHPSWICRRAGWPDPSTDCPGAMSLICRRGSAGGGAPDQRERRPTPRSFAHVTSHGLVPADPGRSGSAHGSPAGLLHVRQQDHRGQG